MSRYHDKNEVSLRTNIFKMAEHLLNYKVKIDGFASPENKKSNIFFSRTPARGASGTNALAINWKNLKGLYLNPPWTLIYNVLLKIKAESASALLVTPLWRAAPWFPLLEELTVKSWVPSQKDIYKDRYGFRFPPPKWLTRFSLVKS